MMTICSELRGSGFIGLKTGPLALRGNQMLTDAFGIRDSPVVTGISGTICKPKLHVQNIFLVIV